MGKHKNNFDFLRFLLAIFVIITHSFALMGISEKQEWLLALTGNQVSFSAVGLSGFFTISGYFIYVSLMRSENLKIYLKKRFLRIFPGLFVVLLLTLLIIPFVYTGETSLISNSSYLTYLPRNLSLYGFQGMVTGVFEELPYKSVNGSLWTIQYEFSLYIGLILLYFIKPFKSIQLALTISTLLIMIVLYRSNFNNIYDSQVFQILGIHVLNLGSFFVAGTILAQLNLEKWNHSLILIITSILIGVALYFGIYNDVKHVLFPLAILCLGFLPIKVFQRFSNFGDASYGIYIYAFPIQQVLIYYLNLTLVEFIISSIILSIIMGYVSWHLVEKRALYFK